MIHSFLMVGQSNMSGRGFIKEVPRICNERIKVFRNGRWIIMMEPINYDRPYAGVGPAASFAVAWCNENKEGEIGLIPCAEGSTSLDDWDIDGNLFRHAILQAKLAKENSKLEAILWHQGENECAGGNYKNYHEKFSKIVDAFKRELDEPNIPIIIGGIGEYLGDGFLGQYFSEFNEVNKELESFALKYDNCYFATAKDLTPNPDGIHLNAVSQRIFGLRYFEAYKNQNHILQSLNNEDSAINIDENREKTKTEKMALLENEFAGGHISLKEYQKEVMKVNSKN